MRTRWGTSVLCAAALALSVGTGVAASSPAQAACTTYPQYTVTADTLSVRTQPNGNGETRGTARRGDHFNYRSASADGVWYYGYAENIGFGFVLGRYLNLTGSYTHC